VIRIEMTNRYVAYFFKCFAVGGHGRFKN
jgi:hypothetical protein